jgi:hypothetical protein
LAFACSMGARNHRGTYSESQGWQIARTVALILSGVCFWWLKRRIA